MLKLPEYKELTEHKPIKEAKLPGKVYLPILQHFGRPCDKILVAVNDLVQTGQVIATGEKGVFSPIHASVSGKVIAIGDYPHPLSGKAKAIVIESDGKDEKAYSQIARNTEEIEDLTVQQIKDIIFSAGIVGLGGAGFPTHIKLSPAVKVDTFILNAAECEPYLNVDNRLLLENLEGVILGVKLIIKVLGVNTVIIAIEDNKKEAIEKLKRYGLPSSWKIKILKTRYPQGAEKQVIKSCLNKEVPQGKLPFDVGVVVNNVGTAYAIYEAVYKHKPLYEKVVTVAGHNLENPSNLKVRLGTPIRDLIEQCGPLSEVPKKILIGGPMMGVAQCTDEVPVIKTTSGVLLLTEKEVKDYVEDPCIRCGACIRACSSGLEPCLINILVENQMWNELKKYNISDCVECGLCNYVCPAKRRLTQSIKRAKLEVRK